MAILYGRAGQVLIPDGVEVPLRLGNEGQLITQRLHARHYEAAKRGALFHASTTILGLAIPIYTGTAPKVMLFNPLGSGVNAELVSVGINRASGTTVQFTAGLMRVPGNVGAGPATGGPVTVFTPDTPDNLKNGLLGFGAVPKVMSQMSGTITLAAAGVAGDFFYSIMHSYAAVFSDTPDGGMFVHDFEGRVIVPPGAAIFLAGSVASVALYATTFSWVEIPV